MRNIIKLICAIVFLTCACIPSFAAEKDLEKAVAELVVKLLPVTASDAPKPSVAIMTFTTENKAISFEKYLNSVLFEQFFGTGKMKLIERESIEKVLTEQNFQISGNVDDASAKKIGNIVGVDFVCYGSVLDMDSILRISGKMVNVQTGEIVSIGSVNAAKDDRIAKLLDPAFKGNTSLVVTGKGDTSTLKNYWIVEKNRNEFDGVTTHVFTLNSSKGYFIVIGCSIADDPSKSYVWSGLRWKDSGAGGIYEFKGDDTKIIKFVFGDNWKYKDTTREIWFAGTDKSRDYLNFLLNNNKVVVRKGETIQTFSSYGLAQAIKTAGLTYKDFDEAMKNREF